MLNDPTCTRSRSAWRVVVARPSAASGASGELLAARHHRLAALDHPAASRRSCCLQRYWQSGLSAGGVKECPRSRLAQPRGVRPLPSSRRGALRRGLLPRVPAHRAAQDRPRPHGRKRTVHGHPRRRVRLVDLGAGERPLRARLAAAGPRRRARARHRGHPGHPDLRRPAVAGAPVPGDRRGARDRPAHPVGRAAGGRLHPPRVPLPRRAASSAQIVARYADHPAVIGFQVDNEPGNELLHNHGVFQRFVDHLRARPTATSRPSTGEWGLVYWSHRLSTWADLWTPDGNAQPQYDLAWRRFQAALTTEFIGWQADIVREYARPRPVRHHVHRLRAAGRRRRRARPTASTSPPATPTTRCRTASRCPTTGCHGAGLDDDRHLGAVPERRPDVLLAAGALPRHRDRRAGASASRGTTGPPTTGSGARPPGRWCRAAPRMIEYWHWHTLHFGTETYWGGVLPHSGEPGRDLPRDGRLGAEFDSGGRPRRRAHPGRRRRHALLDAEQVAHAVQYPPLARGGRRSRTTARTRASSSPSTAAPSTRACRCASCTRGQLVGHRGVRHRARRRGRRHPVLVVARPLHRRRRHPRLAGAYAARRRPPGPRAAHRLRRRRGAGPARADAGAPGRSPPVSGTTSSATSTARRCPSCGDAGRPAGSCAPAAAGTRWVDGLHAHRRRRPRDLRAPALRPLARRHHPRARAGRVTTVGTVPDPTWRGPWPSGWRRWRAVAGSTSPNRSP